MKEKFDTDIDCLEGYNTGYNKNIDAYVYMMFGKNPCDKLWTSFHNGACSQS